jgi:hypothetical protein
VGAGKIWKAWGHYLGRGGGLGLGRPVVSYAPLPMLQVVVSDAEIILCGLKVLLVSWMKERKGKER